MSIVIPKNGINFLATCLDRGIHITEKDETEKHLKPRDTPEIFTRVIFGNIRGLMTSGKPSHHCRSKIGALQNALESLLVDSRVIKTGNIVWRGKLFQEVQSSHNVVSLLQHPDSGLVQISEVSKNLFKPCGFGQMKGGEIRKKS